MDKKIILFQGDSITDCNRTKDQVLGDGYVSLIAKKHPDWDIINRGISGNKTSDLRNRWNEDGLDLKPDILCIMVGINDIWHKHAFGIDNSMEQIINNYRYLLESMKNNNPHIKILMIEPFVLVIDDFQKSWRHELDLLIDEVRDLARVYADEYIPLDGIFAEKSVHINKQEICGDGVHPTLLGHSIIKDEVLKRIEKLM